MSVAQLFAQHAAPVVPGQPSPYREQFLREQATRTLPRVLLDAKGHLITPKEA